MSGEVRPDDGRGDTGDAEVLNHGQDDTGDAPTADDGQDEGGEDDLIEELRRRNPVDVEALPSSQSAEATRVLEQILDSSDPSEAEFSPAAGDCGGREEPPPRD